MMENLEDQLIKKLREENSIYRNNYEQLRKAHQLQLNKCDQLTTQIEQLKQEKEQFERDHNVLVNDWRQQLESKAQEFDRLRQELKPRDINALRVEFFAEFEEDARKRWAGLYEEVDRWREQYLQLQRQYDKFKIQIQTKDNDYQATLEDLAIKHKEDVQHLQFKLQEKEQALDDHLMLVEKVRETTRLNGELQIKVKALINEVEEVRASKIEDHSQYEQQVKVYRRQAADLDTLVKQTQGEKDALKSKLERIDEEYRSARKRQEESSLDNAHLRQELAKMTSKFDEMHTQYQSEAHDKNLAFLKEKNQWQNEMSDTKKQMEKIIQEKQHILKERDDALERLTSQEKQALNQVRSAREEEWAKQRILENEKRELEKNLAQISQQFQEEKIHYDNDRKSANKEMDRLRVDLHGFQAKNHQLATQNEKMSLELESLRNELREIRNKLTDSETKMTQLSVEVNNSKRVEQEARSQVNSLEAANQDLTNEIDSLKDTFSKEKRILENLLDREKLDRKKERDSLHHEISQLRRDVQTFQEDQETLKTVIKKLKQGYKKRLETMKAHVSSTQNELAQTDAENKTLRKTLENENHFAQLKLREVYRKQEDFMRFLQKEGLTKTKGRHEEPPALPTQ